MIKNFFKDEEGAGLVEYALLVVLIAIVCIGAITATGTSVRGVFQTISGTLGS
jgi:pilus assembly protein Flp/PilA